MQKINGVFRLVTLILRTLCEWAILIVCFFMIFWVIRDHLDSARGVGHSSAVYTPLKGGAVVIPFLPEQELVVYGEPKRIEDLQIELAKVRWAKEDGEEAIINVVSLISRVKKGQAVKVFEVRYPHLINGGMPQNFFIIK